MGRAIDMETKIERLESKMNEVFLILEEISKVGTKQEHIDIHEKTKETKANDEGSGSGTVKHTNSKRTTKKKSNTNTDSSK